MLRTCVSWSVSCLFPSFSGAFFIATFGPISKSKWAECGECLKKLDLEQFLELTHVLFRFCFRSL